MSNSFFMPPINLYRDIVRDDRVTECDVYATVEQNFDPHLRRNGRLGSSARITAAHSWRLLIPRQRTWTTRGSVAAYFDIASESAHRELTIPSYKRAHNASRNDAL
jgi:hypothetical protein